MQLLLIVFNILTLVVALLLPTSIVFAQENLLESFNKTSRATMNSLSKSFLQEMNAELLDPIHVTVTWIDLLHLTVCF